MPRILTILFATLLIASCGGKTVTRAPADGSIVGMARRDYRDADRLSWDRTSQRPLATTIWYPAAADAKMSEIAVPSAKPVFVGGWAAPDAAIAEGGKYPLIVVSHGTGGSAFQMMWFGRRLAANGYIVAAVDHHGNTAAEPGFDPRGFRMPWERARDISAMIDALLADPVFGPQIDPARIGGAGYSLGGYTMAALAGGMTSLSGFQSFCSSASRDATCDPQPEFPQADEKFAAMLESDPSLAVSVATHAQPFADARIKSFVLIAPALAQAITDESLLRISAPVLVIAASADSIAPAATNARRFADKIRTSTYRSFDSARHFAFLNECSPKGGKRVPVCKDAPGVDRSAIHDEAALLAVNHYGASFSEGRP